MKNEKYGRIRWLILFPSGIEVGGMRTHFYPEGGWGWLVCAAGFLALLLTTGMQLAFGLLHVHAVRRFGEEHLMDLGMFSYTFLHALPIFSPLLYDNTFLSRERNIFVRNFLDRRNHSENISDIF